MYLTRLLAIGLALFAAACAVPGPSDAEITERDLLARERFWPYRVALVRPWTAAAGEPISPPATGVLIRVEPSGRARIDFGHRGKFEIPVGYTDLLDRANATRTGALEKAEPNFVHAIQSRLLDSSSGAPRPLAPEASEGRAGFLCVFADPGAPEFAEIARALAPLRDRTEVLTIVFAQGRHPDEALADRLRALEWPVPFLHDFLAEPYTRTLLAEGTPFPHLLLQTSEGRVVFQSRWNPQIVPSLVAAWDAAFVDRSVRFVSSAR